MKKTLKVVLIILSALLVLCIALGIWQRENIFAVLDAVKYSQEDLSTLLTDNEKIVSDALEEYPELNVPNIQDEELKALEEGKITQEDLVDIVLGNTYLQQAIERREEEKKAEQSAGKDNVSSSGAASSDAAKDGDAKVAALIAKMYVLKSSYIGKLDSLVSQAKSEYTALPKEKRNAAAKQKIISGNIGKAAALEGECNAKVEAVLSELTSELEAQGKDLSLVASIRKAYANEKQLRKSYYISKYLN